MSVFGPSGRAGAPLDEVTPRIVAEPPAVLTTHEGWDVVCVGPAMAEAELPNGGTIRPKPGDKYCMTSMCHVDARAFVGSLS